MLATNLNKLTFKTCAIWSLLIVGLVASNTSAAITTLTNTKKIENQISKIVSQSLKGSAIGYIFFDLKTNRLLLEKNANLNFCPASTQKIFIAAAALDILGKDYIYQTKLGLRSENIEGDTLKGNVFIDFSGDPTLETKHLIELLNHLKEIGVKNIQGDIIIQTPKFNPPDYADGWTIDSKPYAYSAPIKPITIDNNLIRLTLLPSQQINKPSAWQVEDDKKRFFHLENNSVNGVTDPANGNFCDLLVNMNKENMIYTCGCTQISKQPRVYELAIRNTRLYVENLILDYFLNNNMTFQGKFNKGVYPTNVDNQKIHSSVPMVDIVKSILKDSNNLYSEVLLKTIGQHKFKEGTFNTGIAALNDWLNNNVKSLKNYLPKLYDASGMSRYNLNSPLQQLELLKYIYKNNNLRDNFLSALAETGKEGTLKYRFVEKDDKPHIFGKTGTMTGVSGINGYVKTKKDHIIAFSILVNNSELKTEQIKKFEEDILNLIYSNLN